MSTDGAPQRGDDDLIVVSERVPPPSQVNDSIVVGCSVAAAVFGIGFGVTLLLQQPVTLYGGLLALALLCLAVAVRRFFTDHFPDIEALEPREEAEPRTAVDRVTHVVPVQRRSFLRRCLLGAAALLGLSFLAPVASLGPPPGDRLRTTVWRSGLRVVDGAGRPIRAEQVAGGGIATGWPDGFVGDEKGAVVVLRLPDAPRPPTNLDWVVDERVVVYSKICTHAGCPVALYRERDNALFCPCHQSTFDPERGALPTFGPAARALPQLPLGVDEDGFLVALDDFEDQVGPAFG